MSTIENITYPAAAREYFSAFVGNVVGNPNFNIYAQDRNGLGLLALAAQKAFLEGLEKAKQKDDRQRQEAERFLQTLDAYKADQCMAFLIDGCPVDLEKLPPTPVTKGQWWSNEKTPDAELFSLAIHSYAGDFPASLAGMQSGAYFHNLTPRLGDEYAESSLGAGEFPIHTDRSFAEKPNRAISLLALRQQAGAHTGIIYVDELLAVIRRDCPQIMDDLKTVKFNFISNQVFTEADGKQRKDSFIGTILREEAGKTYVRINLAEGCMVPVDDSDGKGARLLSTLRNIMKKYPELDRGCTIQPGQMLVARNDMGVIHFRKAFEPGITDAAGGRRWLLRVCTEPQQPAQLQ